MTRRALMVTPGYTIVDGHPSDPYAAVRRTPEETWTRGLGALLDRLAKTVDRQAVLLLDGPAARALNLPSGPEDLTTVGTDDARAAGWLSGKLGHAWVPFYGEGRPRIVVGLAYWPEFGRSPLVDPASSIDTVYRCAMWQDLTGHAWEGTPGVAAMTILRDTIPTYEIRGRKTRPSFAYRAGPEGASERAFQAETWARPQTTRYAHGWDFTRMYLAAAGGCECLAPWMLKQTGRIDFTPKLAGWWKVKLGPWSEDRIPAPAGPGEDVRWVTTPTLALLAELIEAAQRDPSQPYQDFEVLDSWTGQSRRLFRRYAETLDGAYMTARALAESISPDDLTDSRHQDARAVMAAAKEAFREGNGMLNHTDDDGKPASAIFRPDWHFAVIAQARSNLWRRMWAVAQAEDRWPLEITVDHVWYGSDLADPLAAKPEGIPLVNARGETDALGTFKPKDTREMGRAA